MKVPLHVYCKNYISHTELKHKSDQKKIERLCSYVFHGNLNSMFQLFLILTTDQILKYTRFYQNAKNNFHLGGTEIWGIISYTRLISWVYMTFSVSVDILIFLGGEIGQNDHVYPACSDFRKCIFFQFRTSFDQSNYTCILEENSPFGRHIPQQRVSDPLRYSRSGSEYSELLGMMFCGNMYMYVLQTMLYIIYL